MQVRDIDIIVLFDRRDEQAIAEMQRKYGSYCRTVALNILKNASDAEECLNDVWLKVWNSIPPAAPDDLRNYAGEVTRNTALDMLRKRNTKRSKPSSTSFFSSSTCVESTSMNMYKVRLRLFWSKTRCGMVSFGSTSESVGTNHVESVSNESACIAKMESFIGKVSMGCSFGAVQR